MSKKPEWAEALDRLLSQRGETVPPGWKTAREVGEQLGVCYEMAKLKCAELVAAGLAERKDFRVKWGRGIRGLPHYRLIQRVKSTRR
jgi:predicted ArsR family transcriptional regulator